jgi:hypothetical protein
LGRHTLSGLLCTAGQQFRDWSAAYRLFERERLHPQALWLVPLKGVLETLPPANPVVALLDDTLIRKRGHRIAGTSWRRDPLGPHFADNFIWASRFLQISLALPEHPAAPASSARAIPVDLQHAPSPRKPSRCADAQQWQSWRALSAAATSSRRGAERLTHLRQAIDEFAGGGTRPLLVCADATFINRTVLRDLPPRTTLIGHIRKDARLYALPTAEEENHGRGRHRCYCQLRPTPEQWRRDESGEMAPTSTSVDGLETMETRNYPISRAPQARHRCAGRRANRRQLRWTVAPRKHSSAQTRSVERLLRLARTSRAHGAWLVQPAEPPDADPHVRSCGRGGRATVPAIPIGVWELAPAFPHTLVFPCTPAAEVLGSE